jgi:hypothetical protein
MKRTIHSMLFGAIFLTALAGLAPAANARSCSMEGVAGRYGYTTTGTIPSLGAVAAVGHVTLEANGNLTGAQTASFNGAIVPETLSGTYTVNADCTGTATVNVYHGGVLARTTNIATVFDNNEREFRAIFLTSGTVLTIQGKRLFSDED